MMALACGSAWNGIDGQAWDNSLAAAPPEYNADFTEGGHYRDPLYGTYAVTPTCPQ